MYIEEILKCSAVMIKVGHSILIGHIANWEISPATSPLGQRHILTLNISDSNAFIDIEIFDLNQILRYDKGTDIDIELDKIRDKIDFATRPTNGK